MRGMRTKGKLVPLNEWRFICANRGIPTTDAAFLQPQFRLMPKETQVPPLRFAPVGMTIHTWMRHASDP